jgi:hypothetical protein
MSLSGSAPLLILLIALLFLGRLQATAKHYLVALCIVFFTWLISVLPQLSALFLDGLNSNTPQRSFSEKVSVYFVIPAEAFVYVCAIFAPIVISFIVEAYNAIDEKRPFTTLHLTWYLYNVIIVFGCFGISILLFVSYKSGMAVNPDLAEFYAGTLYMTCIIAWYCATVYLNMTGKITDKAKEIRDGLEIS